MNRFEEFSNTYQILEKLGEIFNWEKYERSLIGNKDDNGEHPVLKRHAVSLSKWFKGMKMTWLKRLFGVLLIYGGVRCFLP